MKMQHNRSKFSEIYQQWNFGLFGVLEFLLYLTFFSLVTNNIHADSLDSPVKDFTARQEVSVFSESDNNFTSDSNQAFYDVPPTYWAYNHINAVYNAGITGGCGNGNYCPQDLVTREQMAAFLIRAIEGDPDVDYCNGVDPFLDVASGAWSCPHIKRMGELNITGGCGQGNYCPQGIVTREQMAVFIVRALEGNPAANYCNGVAPFNDVSAASWSCGHIKRLVELGVTQGCGNGNYCPGNEVTRDQMAVFLARAFLGFVDLPYGKAETIDFSDSVWRLYWASNNGLITKYVLFDELRVGVNGWFVKGSNAYPYPDFPNWLSGTAVQGGFNTTTAKYYIIDGSEEKGFFWDFQLDKIGDDVRGCLYRYTADTYNDPRTCIPVWGQRGSF